MRVVDEGWGAGGVGGGIVGVGVGVVGVGVVVVGGGRWKAAWLNEGNEERRRRCVRGCYSTSTKCA